MISTHLCQVTGQSHWENSNLFQKVFPEGFSHPSSRGSTLIRAQAESSQLRQEAVKSKSQVGNPDEHSSPGRRQPSIEIVGV